MPKYSISIPSGSDAVVSGASGISEGLGIWMLITLILSIVGGICLYFLFVRKKNTYKGFLSWLHNFLTFKTLFVEAILKTVYCIGAIFITLFSFGLISMPGYGFLVFLFTLLFGNISLRVAYEFLMLTLIIVRNTTDLNKNVTKFVEGNKEKTKSTTKS